MFRRGLTSVLLAGFLFAFVPAASCQQFTIVASQAQGVTNVGAGGTVNMVAQAIGVADSARLTVTYRGSASAAINSIDRTGSNDFSISIPSLPITLSANESVTVTVRFVPSTGSRVSGQVSFTYTEAPSTVPRSFSVNLAGIAPELVYSFLLPGGNATPVLDGGMVPFPPTLVAATTSAALAIINRGTASATISNITLSGSPAFQLSGLPLLPAAVEAGRELRFAANFKPAQMEAQTATVKVEFAGRSVSFRLEGSGASATFIYELSRESGDVPVRPGQIITLPDALVGSRSNAVMRVRNAGNVEAVITGISVLGTGYQLSELPFFPLTMPVGSSVAFVISFAPTQPGRSAGRLRVGNDTFELEAVGLGAALSFSFVMGGTSTVVQNGGTALFSTIQAGQKSTARFVVTNSGTTAATISGIFVSSGASFSLSDLPELPLTLDPGGTTVFTITFSPTTVGVSEATLRVGNHSFVLVGSSTAPPPLPAIVIEGPRGPQQPLQQPSYTLSLAEPYPLELRGTLTLTFNSEVFVNDATVQFATGGRTVTFTIQANTTRAVFQNNESQIRLQTGSVAGTITLSPAVFSDSGVNLTPASPPAVSLTIPQSPPQFVSAQLGGKTTTSFSLLVTGYSTGRTVSRIELQATAVAGETITNPRLTLDVEPAFLAWYQNAQSQQFGSLFTAVLPVNVEGTALSGANLVNAIQSVSVALTNSLGSSGSRTVELR